jgi:pimeloyl-ACP methyl ester carboxylesterase
VLEVIHKGSATESHPVPLLFVHGAWHGAWCWDEHFLDFFADRGYACYAPSLRGHGASPGRERLRWTGLQDYVRDVAKTAAQLPTQPVLVGHSMGGFVIQKYLEHHTAAGAILVAAIPPTGVLRATLHIARCHPMQFVKVNASLRLAPLVATPELVRDLLFSASTPDKQVNTYQQRLEDESYLAFLGMLALDLVKTKHVNRVPMLVLGAEDDTIVSQRQIRRTAAVYGAEAEIFPDMGHDMMLEPGWQAVAERMLGWLAARELLAAQNL